MTDSVLFVLDNPCLRGGARAEVREVAPDVPIVSATDLGVTRGDGVFEVVGVRGAAGGAAHLHVCDAHLARLARSARLLEMPEPDRGAFAEAIATAAAALGLAEGEGGAVKVVFTRGPEAAYVAGEARPTAWAYGWRLADHSALQREGLSVATMSRGYARGGADAAPWLLIGAKYLAYAVNRAAEREAARRGADEALFVSSDGFVLEGPTWTFGALIDGVMVSVPAESGVLPGTTQGSAFEYLDSVGAPTAMRDIPVAELATVEAAWQFSSTELAVPIREIDGRPVPMNAELTAQMNAALAARTS